MNNQCPLKEIEEQIERIVKSNPDPFHTPRDHFDAYENAAIAILDSPWNRFPEGILECHLNVYLFCKQREIGVADTI